MNIAEKYFNEQKQDPDFIASYNSISEKVDIEWELERLKQYIQKDYEKKVILDVLERLQSIIHQATLRPQIKAMV